MAGGSLITAADMNGRWSRTTGRSKCSAVHAPRGLSWRMAISLSRPGRLPGFGAGAQNVIFEPSRPTASPRDLCNGGTKAVVPEASGSGREEPVQPEWPEIKGAAAGECEFGENFTDG